MAPEFTLETTRDLVQEVDIYHARHIDILKYKYVHQYNEIITLQL